MKNLILLLIVGLAFTMPAYAGDNENDSDRLSANQSNTFSAGYINAAKQQAAAIANRKAPDKSVIDATVEQVQSKTASQTDENRQENSEVTPNLKGPMGGGEETAQVQAEVANEKPKKGLGDVNGDGTVDVDDLARLLQAYGFSKGSARYDKDADFNKDGIVNATDLTTVLSCYNTVYDNKPEVSKPIATATDPYRGRGTRTDEGRSPSDYYKTSYQDKSTTNKLQDTTSKVSALSGDEKTALTKPQEGDVNAVELAAERPDQSEALSASAKEPTEEDKAMLDTVSGLLNDMSNIDGEASPELKKATDDLVQVVANILLAQAVPDLLKEGDMANIKGIFSNLDSSKTKIVSGYMESTKPYYEEVKKLLEKNANVLGVSLKNILEKDLRNTPRNEIDKILAKLRSKENRSFEENYILQQENKVRAKYLDPGKQKLEEGMKIVIENATKKLNMTLGTMPKKK